MAQQPNPPAPPTPAPAPSPLPWTLIGVGLLGAVIMAAVCALFYFFDLRPKPSPQPPPPPITLEVQGTPHVGRICTIVATTAGKTVKWQVLSGPDKPDLLQHDPHSVHFVTPTAGDYRLQGMTVIGTEVEYAETHVLVDTGPTPPVPPVPPIPPGPGPPIPGNGLRLLAIYDPATLGKLTPAQLDVLNSETVRGWLRSHAAVGPDGKTVESRFLPSNEDMTNESKLWQDAFKRPRASLPWLIISNGKTGYEGPLPATVNDMMTLMQKYATPAP
jgi:hypothetical protein